MRNQIHPLIIRVKSFVIGIVQRKNKGVLRMNIEYLEQLKQEGILDLISELGKLTDEELELLVQASQSQIGVA